MYDAIIVGARCAGSPLAMLLARKGHSVLLVDRDSFPSDTLSTAFLRPGAAARLAEWGLMERFLATGPSAPDRIDVYWNGALLPLPGAGQPMYSPRRTVFDKLLIDAAREAGAEVREGFSVRDLLRGPNGEVTGVAGHDAQNGDVQEEARIVIGADGRNSFVARAVGAEEYDIEEGHSCGYYSFYSGLPLDRVELHMIQRHVLFSFPTHNQEVCLAVEGPMENWSEARENPKAWVEGKFRELAPSIGKLLDTATNAERWFGMSARRSFLRKPYGNGWALVGDAGFLKDPVLGTGIDDAFRDAEYVSKALDDVFKNGADMETALAAFHERRDAAALPGYALINEFARMEEVTPDMLMRFLTLDAPAGAAVPGAAAGGS